MDSATFPAAYSRWMRSVIALAIREAQRDAALRAGHPTPGFRPIPEDLLDRNATGEAVVAVIPIPTEEAQLLEEFWPDSVPEGVSRFPGFRTLVDALGIRRVAEPTTDKGKDKR